MNTNEIIEELKVNNYILTKILIIILDNSESEFRDSVISQIKELAEQESFIDSACDPATIDKRIGPIVEQLLRHYPNLS